MGFLIPALELPPLFPSYPRASVHSLSLSPPYLPSIIQYLRSSNSNIRTQGSQITCSGCEERFLGRTQTEFSDIPSPRQRPDVSLSHSSGSTYPPQVPVTKFSNFIPHRESLARRLTGSAKAWHLWLRSRRPGTLVTAHITNTHGYRLDLGLNINIHVSATGCQSSFAELDLLFPSSLFTSAVIIIFIIIAVAADQAIQDV